MYTRTYFSDNEEIKIPDNYDGNAFEKTRESIALPQEESINRDLQPEPEEEAVSALNGQRLFSAQPLRSLFGKIPFLSGLKLKGDKAISIGFEEILICALALYMLLSRDGDKECAVMLILLLFIG